MRPATSGAGISRDRVSPDLGTLVSGKKCGPETSESRSTPAATEGRRPCARERAQCREARQRTQRITVGATVTSAGAESSGRATLDERSLHCGEVMGLDGGTFASRADVLRRASWSLATADTSRSTRGGAISRGSLVRTPLNRE